MADQAEYFRNFPKHSCPGCHKPATGDEPRRSRPMAIQSAKVFADLLLPPSADKMVRAMVVEAITARDDAIRAEERERAAKVADAWLGEFAEQDIQFVPARKYAVDAVQDIRDAIRAHEPTQSKEPADGDTER